MIKPDSIKARLKNIAINEGKQFDYLLMLYMVERFLYRVSISIYADKFVLKGGLLLYTILDEKARATKDVDMLAREMNNTLENIGTIIREVCSIKTDDALVFDLESITIERIKEDADYEGVRAKVTAYLERTRKLLQIDIGFGDIIVPGAIIMEYPSLLDMDKPVIKVYSLESVIAEKFEAMIFLADANSRMKDFYDIYSLSKKYNFDGKILAHAIRSTFINRKTPMPDIPTVFTEAFRESKEKKIQWNAFKKRIKSKNEFEFSEIINLLKVFLEPIYKAMISKEDFGKVWDAKTQSWI